MFSDPSSSKHMYTQSININKHKRINITAVRKPINKRKYNNLIVTVITLLKKMNICCHHIAHLVVPCVMKRLTSGQKYRKV